MYVNAGENGLFLLALTDRSTIENVVTSISSPLNLMAITTSPTASELARLGVRRISTGGSISQSVLGEAKRLIQASLNDGRSDLFPRALPYSEMQDLFMDLEEQ